ncbi:hypothetical protein [Mangrovibacterium lignilyticum]|uniref:hypothetical protein n=1 Tax=Mangrovibacterium lignilyticum TaxID=2668052 RepID=UPI0013D0B72A|nr:hypothetical protein [Mangrovibacterium lignilyticum]
MKKLLVFILVSISAISVFGQYSQLQPGDTIKAGYPYRFPLLGAKAYEKGFDIPYPWGGMLNFFAAKQDIEITEIGVGLTDGVLPDIPLTDLGDLIEFGELNARVTSLNIRPDLWVLPFLDVYGIFGKTWAETTVELTYPVTMKTVAELSGTSYGFGLTGAGGLGKFFFVLDGNWVWTNMSNFKDPVKTKNFSFRIGKAFKLAKAPESNIALWAGAMRIKMGGVTEGSIGLYDLLPSETWDRRDEIVEQYWTWYDNEASLPQKVLADKILTPIMNKLGEADGSGMINYRIRKQPKQEWNMLIGGQYQFDKHHQFRVEAGVFGNRKSLLLSYNYRFGFKMKGGE